MVRNAGWQPASAQERLCEIDILRGMALFGVLIINILSGFRVPLLEHIFDKYAGLRGVDRLVEILASGLLEFKALTIFSFLFGVGLAVQAERATARNLHVHRFLLRRLTWLLLLGAAHLFLVWNGDILTLYAICGLLLLPFLGLPWPLLVAAGGALIIIPEYVSFGWELPSGPAAAAGIAQARQVYGNEGFLAILKFRWHETWSVITPLLIMVLPRTAGLMCWGAAAWRSGILRAPELNRRKLTAAVAVGAVGGGVLTANDVWAACSGNAFLPALRHTHIDASILLATAYVSGLLLWLTPRRIRLAQGLTAIGRMALTNYLLQSIVLGFIFYGYGLGLFGRIGSTAAAGTGVTIYLAQIQLSRLWLRRFRFGPFEWLWRSLTYGRRQPMEVES